MANIKITNRYFFKISLGDFFFYGFSIHKSNSNISVAHFFNKIHITNFDCFYHWVDLIDNPELFEREEIMDAIPEPYYTIGKKSLEKMREAIKSKADPVWTRFYEEMPNYQQEYFPINFKNAIKWGVKIVAGVDAGMGGAGYVPHGFLYKELELFVKYGMDEYDALRTATINAAELLGASDEIGSINQGKYADLVILKSNPVKNISNLRNIEFVIKDGQIVYKYQECHVAN